MNGGYPAVIQKLAYTVNKDLQLAWVGVKYGIRRDIDVAVGYYHAWQNDYTNYDVTPVPNCGPNKSVTGLPPGAAPQGPLRAPARAPLTS